MHLRQPILQSTEPMSLRQTTCYRHKAPLHGRQQFHDCRGFATRHKTTCDIVVKTPFSPVKQQIVTSRQTTLVTARPKSTFLIVSPQFTSLHHLRYKTHLAGTYKSWCSKLWFSARFFQKSRFAGSFSECFAELFLRFLYFSRPYCSLEISILRYFSSAVLFSGSLCCSVLCVCFHGNLKLDTRHTRSEA